MTEEQLNTRTRCMLAECRELAKELATLAESIKELRMSTISSPKMDGMPHGSSEKDAFAARMSRLEKQEKEYERERRRLERLRSAARRAIRPLEARRRLFYEAYYIGAEKASSARKEAGISESTATRYISDVKTKKETGD